ncbi:hypothetical protein [Povalibacter sp.]|uniref:hypothetical protein n=1 Tax=Povalibacter sp. TaxID=1962978 RepID=UPI002F419C7A
MAEAQIFQSAAEAFEYACDHVDCSLKDGRAVLAVVLGVQGRMCSVKIANTEDKTIPSGTLTELLARTDLVGVCFSTMIEDKVPHLEPGDLVMYTTMPELAAVGKTTVAGTVISRVNPHYTAKGGWQVRPVEEKKAPSGEDQNAAPSEGTP